MKSRGYILVDTVIALFLIGAAASLLALASGRINRGLNHLEDRREADRLANEAILSLQVDNNPQPIEGAEITVEPIPDLKAPTGWHWVVVKCKTSRAESEISGLIKGER